MGSRRFDVDEEQERIANLSAKRQRSFKQRRLDAGLRRVAVWVPADRAQELRDFASRLVGTCALVAPTKCVEREEARQAVTSLEQRTRKQVIQAMAAEVGDSVEEVVRELGAGLDEALERFAKRQRIVRELGAGLDEALERFAKRQRIQITG